MSVRWIAVAIPFLQIRPDLPRRLLSRLLILVYWLSASVSQGAEELFQYDAAGRLRGIGRNDGGITLYRYDALGNLRSVRILQQARPPVVESVEPESVRAGERETVRVTGTNLSGSAVIPPDFRFEITDLVADNNRLSFLLAPAEDAATGDQIFRVTNTDGEAVFELQVLPPLPQLSVLPLPLALPEDGALRHFLVRLSRVATVDHRISLSLSDTAVAVLESAEIVIPAGSTEVQAGIRGLASGVTLLQLSGEGLESRTYSVYVTADYGGVNSVHSTLLGVAVGDSQEPIDGACSIRATPLGLTVGAYVDAVEPQVVAVDTDPVRLTVHGVGLAAVDELSLAPADGILLSDFEVSPDGTFVSVFAGIDTDASPGPRRVVLHGIDGPYPPAYPGADLINITPPAPRIGSLVPNYGVRGVAALTLTLHGRNLDQATAVSFHPADGIAVGTDLQTEAGGTVLNATLAIAPDAPLGGRLVIVTTPAGTSGMISSVANTFHVVSETGPVFRSVTSARLGIQVGEYSGPQPFAVGGFSSPLGVAYGDVADGLSPDRAEKGTSVLISISGAGLESVTSAWFEPADGLDVDNIRASTDGDSLVLEVSIAADAAETWRRLRLFRDGAEFPFADGNRALFLITGPLPEIRSLWPSTLEIGTGPTSFTLTGRNLDRTAVVRAMPADGLQLGPPSVDSGGSRLTVTIEASSSADPGARVLTVTTPAGTSNATPSPANTLNLYRQALFTTDSLVAPLLGVALGEGGMIGFQVDPVVSNAVGVTVGEDTPVPDGRIGGLTAPLVGVSVGAYATAVMHAPLIVGDTYTLVVHGRGLEGVDGVGVFPGWDLTPGTPLPAADGSSLLLPFTLPADAAVVLRELRLVAGANLIPFVDPARARLDLAAGAPEIDSLSPIVIRPGETAELTLRGRHLKNTGRVFAEPATGIVFASTFASTADGGELRIRIHAQQGAAPGARTIRVETPGGTSTGQASPANTLTIY